MKKLRIAWFSPVSDEGDSCISEYCSERLLPHISRAHEVEVFTNSLRAEAFGVRASHYLKAFERHREQSFDVFFYQLEDGIESRFVRAHCGLVPGVLWAHDVFLRDLGAEGYHTSPWEQSIRQYYSRNEPFSDRSKAPHQLWPRIYRESSLSPVVLFSSRWGEAEFQSMISTRLESLGRGHMSGLLPIPTGSASSNNVRVPENSDAMRIAYHGLPGMEGRCHKFLPAVKGLSINYVLTWMVPFGGGVEAHARIAEFGLDDSRIEVIESASPKRWQEVVEASDVAFHLHAGAYGRMSPFLEVSYSVGCPVVVLASGSGDDLPSDAAFHIHSGLFESEEIKSLILRIRELDAIQLRRQFYRYARQNLDAGVVAEKLGQVLVDYAPSVGLVMDRWESLRKRGQQALLQEVKKLVSGSEVISFDSYTTALEPAIKELGWTK
jgi:hypothetical protein